MFLTFFLTTYSIVVSGQNLIRNGSFESLDCPSEPSHCAKINEWYSANLMYLFLPTSICNGLSFIKPNGQAQHSCGVPCNFYGCSQPYHGNSYLALKIYIEPFWLDSANYWSQRNYAAQLIEEPLEEDSIYCFKAKLKLADRHGYAFLTTNTFGVKFTVDSLVDYSFPTGMNELNAVPYISLGENDYITDTLNWTEFKAYYKAKGGEQFITMGNINYNHNTPIIIIKPELNTGQYFESITFYLDDIGLYPNECPAETDTTQPPQPKVFSTLQLPSAFTPNNGGKNDVFRVLGSPQVSNFKLCVYNRWGKQVYCGNTIYDGWDGNCNGTPCEMATYQWVATYTDVLSGEQRVERGNVTLLR